MLIPLFQTDVHSKIHIGKAMAHNSKILIRFILENDVSNRFSFSL